MIIEALLIFIASIVGYNAKDVKQTADGKHTFEAEAGNPAPVFSNHMTGGSGDKN